VLKTPIGRLRFIGMAEGLSFVLLLGIAMPLKYLAGMPMAVRIVGMAHGILFILYVAAIIHTTRARGWPMMRAATLLGASLIPLGPFFVDGQLRREEADGLPAPSPVAD
jgi:integral membrane protein